MALTQAQLNAQLRLIVAAHFTGNDGGMRRFLETCRDHANAGGANEKEASRTLAREVYQRVIGRVPTVRDIHWMTTHRIDGGEVL